jgi:hypothetical protein
MWDTINGILQFQPALEKLIRESGPETGWVRYPMPAFQNLIKTVAESSDPEIRERLKELDALRQKAEDIWAVIQMSSWEKTLEEDRRHEKHRKSCFQRFQEWKREKREMKEFLRDAFEKMEADQALKSSGFRGD